MTSTNVKSKNPANSDELQLKEVLAKESLSDSIFEQLIDLFPDIVHSVDQSNRIVSTNIKELDLLGYSREELIGMPIERIYDDNVVKDMRKGMRELKSTGMKGVKSTLLTKTGESIDVEIRSISLYGKDGEFVKTFSIIRDIRELNNMRKQLVQSNKLASVGELASGILHDIKNPLSIITGYADIIGNHLEKRDHESIKLDAEKISKAANKIKKILDHMRVYVRSEQEEFSDVKIHDVISDSIFMLESPIRFNDVKVINDIPEDLSVLGIHNQLEQVFVNIMGNACDAMASSKKREIKLDYFVASNEVTISISDSGPGMPAKVTEKVFESFFTTKEKGKGTGLGLSISKGIISEHNGKISVKSEVGQGTTFTIILPVGR